MPTIGETARALRRRPPGRALVIVGVLLVAFLASRSCQRSVARLAPDKAVAIAQTQIDFQPEGHTVRLVQQGIPPTRYWAVSLWIRNRAEGGYKKLTVVLVNATTGKVAKVYVNQR